MPVHLFTGRALLCTNTSSNQSVGLASGRALYTATSGPPAWPASLDELALVSSPPARRGRASATHSRHTRPGRRRATACSGAAYTAGDVQYSTHTDQTDRATPDSSRNMNNCHSLNRRRCFTAVRVQSSTTKFNKVLKNATRLACKQHSNLLCYTPVFIHRSRRLVIRQKAAS